MRHAQPRRDVSEEFLARAPALRFVKDALPHFGAVGVGQAKPTLPVPGIPSGLLEIIGRPSAIRLHWFHDQFGIKVADQLRAAVGTWIRYVDYVEKCDGPKSSEHLGAVMRESAGILDWGETQLMLEIARGDYVSKFANTVWRRIVAWLHSLPAPEAVEMARGLRDIIEPHIGLADEHRALRDFVEGFDGLGESYAIDPPVKP